MFNFMKLERRIKLKGFENILYSTTGERLLYNCTTENWNYLLQLYMLLEMSRDPSRRAADQSAHRFGIPGFENLSGIPGIRIP